MQSDPIDCVERNETLHDIIDDIKSLFVNRPYKGLSSVDSFGRSLHCRAVFAAYPTDIPEAKKLSSVKYGSVTDRSFTGVCVCRNHD